MYRLVAKRGLSIFPHPVGMRPPTLQSSSQISRIVINTEITIYGKIKYKSRQPTRNSEEPFIPFSDSRDASLTGCDFLGGTQRYQAIHPYGM
jgi:hypothetical protein